ncbi:MAG: hypothetical protein M9949_04695 [Candidatus Kapabacteria bacterium]|nr:hypothetical protein [Candidatus Kapabacteria bacterium]
MTLEQISYGILAIFLAAIVSSISTVLIQIWIKSGTTTEKNAEKDEIRIASEIKSLRDIIDKIEELLIDIRLFIRGQEEKNTNNENNLKAVWKTIGEIKQNLNDLSKDVYQNQQNIHELMNKQDKLIDTTNKHSDKLKTLNDIYNSVKNRVKDLESV